jgi:hypothetical protein
VKRILKIVTWALLAVAALVWGADYAALMLPFPAGKKQWDVVRVDQMYYTRNRFGQIDMAHGDAIMETCGNSMLPHAGKRPCWYVRTHTLHINHLEN